ncbi:MAG: 50S ribosomal protein L3 [Chlamydiae bacterium GWC2_50_10]|uniref:Large ribosomal subunit protein uL3 n=1 Tax=uncultured Chlamydiae bacterium Rifle_16ft_4_minimus_1822 TaxID=1665093 RepID=A0A0H4T4U3_9BACT|nr:50S ribosomal protein L3, large subunit ribosomal protein L3 [uncultured Chlamydiae bacterium Rifle_16ft_4_minimus_1822]OGN52660.1 MAG: 50S ribosomal protein L3 [Chlamydiae bacterium GWA2_50_15]OGN54511.1 MAG: 50S ribosomal protein L3 [Chlamydiae bacterium GWC2_50_10]OGN57895.1 MAG: 50S ribosomal protein L3 [Chlamydiae bacterium RIFCSPHIGHO2_02_FULL_49_29]OGN63518.1 MAG: 50S ribosomal protein L3 [Chlamydiae bacterium RIFCSPHIGHO2_12_FULL_49_32]OGN68375.1 MAG: 50S ribosomal protein L3 [Chlam
MTMKFLGKKEGMAQVYDEKGNLVVCTVISAEPNIVSQVKSLERDGYSAVQLAAFKATPSKVKNISNPLKGHFKKAGIEPRRALLESPVEKIEEYKPGQEIDVAIFADCAFVDVAAVSKGKGFQGVMKRHNFKGGPAAHGSGFHRHGGSTGMRTTPGRCLPGQKMAGRMGGERVRVQNLRIVKVDPEKRCLLVAGAVPGARGSVVEISRAVKKKGK